MNLKKLGLLLMLGSTLAACDNGGSKNNNSPAPSGDITTLENLKTKLCKGIPDYESAIATWTDIGIVESEGQKEKRTLTIEIGDKTLGASYSNTPAGSSVTATAKIIVKSRPTERRRLYRHRGHRTQSQSGNQL